MTTHINLEHSALTYTDHDGAWRTVEGCELTVDNFDRHWIWCNQIKINLVYQTKGREDALLASIAALLFHIQLRDQRIASLQRIADLANAFAEAVKPDE